MNMDCRKGASEDPALCTLVSKEQLVDSASHSRALAWAELHALGIRAQYAPDIIAAGGPQTCLTGERRQLRQWMTARQWHKISQDSLVWKGARDRRQELRYFLHAGGHILTPDHSDWCLGRVDRQKFPLCMYARGNLSSLRVTPRVGIVGSRRPTARAAHRAQRFALKLSVAGAMVCSGGAWGIDLAAHRGAIEGRGGTIAVLGEPLMPQADERPRRLQELGSRCLALMPHGPWVPMSRHVFASRNQWIAALCDAVIVLEGGARSGTVHTVRAALRFGVPVYAVPGDPDEPNSATPNRLIEEGAAKPLLRIESLYGPLGLKSGADIDGFGHMEAEAGRAAQASTQPGHSRAANQSRHSLDPLENLLARRERLTLEQAARELEKTTQEILQMAMMLELAGRVRRLGNHLHLLPTRQTLIRSQRDE